MLAFAERGMLHLDTDKRALQMESENAKEQ